MEVEAVDEGKVGRLLVAEGAEGVAVNTPIALLLGEGEEAGEAPAAGNGKAKPAEAAEEEPERAAAPTERSDTAASDAAEAEEASKTAESAAPAAPAAPKTERPAAQDEAASADTGTLT